MHRSTAVALLALSLSSLPLAPRAAGQQGAARSTAPERTAASAPLSDVAYTVTFNALTARTRTFRVTMDFRVTGDGPVLLSLPAWTPGAYELSFFARWVTNFSAESGDRALRWDKVDHDTWRVQRGTAREVRVSFDYVADSLDNAMSWARPDFLLFNGTNAFLYPEGRPLDFRATVRIDTEPDWLVATGMTPAGRPRTYTAPNYHDLVDMPFFIGRFEMDSAMIENRWTRFATYPVGSVPRAERANVWHVFRRVIPPQAAVFGEVPWETYTVMQIADSMYGGISGLEHQNSHVDITATQAIGSLVLTTIYSHEFVHAWNVKRLRPADLWPYRYDEMQATTWLWQAEGITDYYGDLALLRGGIIDSSTFLRLTESKLFEVAGAPPVALEDASLSTWVDPIDGTSTIYYPKGSIVGLLLDILIRDASDNRASLDDVMRQLYRDTYKRGTGFTGEQWWRAVSAAARGASFDDFRVRYIDGREPLPLARVLPLAGLMLAVDTIREPRLGVTTVQDSAGVIVLEVVPGSAAADAGVRAGDYLLSVGTVPVDDESFGERFRQEYGTRDGVAIPLRVRRGDEVLTLPATLRLAMRFSMRIRPNARASAKAARIRAGIFRGVTDGGRP